MKLYINEDILIETIKKVGDKWVVYPKKGGARLGTHNTRKEAEKQLKAIEASKAMNESSEDYGYVFYHGTPDLKLEGKKGIHIGTYKAARQALEAKIGVPAEGEWNGAREYGKTLIAGNKRLAERGREYGYSCETGYNCRDVPEDDYYPVERKYKAKYSDGSEIPLNVHPTIVKVKIIGPMTNTPRTPISDTRANSSMNSLLKRGKAKKGYFYKNEAEDEGSISAVVPDKSFLKIIG